MFNALILYVNLGQFLIYTVPSTVQYSTHVLYKHCKWGNDRKYNRNTKCQNIVAISAM